MLKSLFALLRMAEAMLTALVDDEVRTYLAESGFPLEQLSQGNSVVERARATFDRSGEARIRSRGLSEAVDRMFGSLFREVSIFRFVALRALKLRTDLVEAFGLGPRAPSAATEAPAGGEPSGAPARKRHERSRAVGPFLAGSLVLVRAVLETEEAVALLAPYGYGKERITSLLTRLEGLEALDLQQEGGQQAFHAATAAAREEEIEFRRWYTPWRRMVRHALSARPDLMQRVGAV